MKTLFRRVFLRILHPLSPMERAYFFENPWRLDSELEQYRYREQNKIITERFGKIDSTLEIGCGEGYQTQWLLKITSVHGIDISKQAVKRARQRVPAATFEAGSLPVLPDRRASLVTAFEMLYYLPDEQIVAAVEILNRAAPRRIVSYHRPLNGDRLDPIILAIPGVQREDIRYADHVWTVAWW